MCKILLFSRLIFFFSFFSTVTEWQKTTKLQSKIFFFFWSSQKSQIFFLLFIHTRIFNFCQVFCFVSNVEEGCDTTEWNIFFCVHIILKWKSLKMLKFFTLCGRKWNFLFHSLFSQWCWCCVMLWVESIDVRLRDFSFIESQLMLKSFSTDNLLKLLKWWEIRLW